jgi:hypothetical protein
MPRVRFVLGVFLVASALSGCGPVISTYLILSADAELAGAEAAQAERYAVYEYTAASEYLAKAREEQGYADFGPSIDYAFKANELAVKAKERSDKERAKDRGPGEMPPGVEAPPPNDDQSGAPNVIIEKAPEAEEGGAPVGVEIVPIPTEEGTRPPE